MPLWEDLVFHLNKATLILAPLLFLVPTAWSAAPTLTGGTASGAAGTTVDLPVYFDPGTSLVASMQFSLTLPAALSAGTLTAGSILTSAGKTVSTSMSGNTWNFIIFGINQNTI